MADRLDDPFQLSDDAFWRDLLAIPVDMETAESNRRVAEWTERHTAMGSTNPTDFCPEHDVRLDANDDCPMLGCKYGDERSGPVRSRDRFGNRRKP